MTRRNLHRRNWPVGGAASIISGLALSLLLGWPVAAAPEELARVDGVAITAEEVDWALGAQLTKLHEQLYNLRRQKVEALVAEKLLAKEAEGRGLSVPTLLDTEVTPKVGLVTEQEIETFYQANKARLQGEEATLREQIRAHLQNEKLTAQREAFVQSLRAQATVVVHLEPPPPLRVQIAVDGAPFKGSAAAPVTIVEFTDFQCPFCKRVQATLEQVQSHYGEQVKVVHRDFPIDTLHPQARKAHEAARCANAQGQFWAYHDVLYAHAPKASPEQLKTYAQDVGLDLAAFEQCFYSGKYQATVQQDVEEGGRFGVTGTPVFFINGRMLSGAQPLERFVQMIEDELARTR
jgi:protein-disulfide isomerase